MIVEDKVYGQDLQRKDFELELSQTQQRSVGPAMSQGHSPRM